MKAYVPLEEVLAVFDDVHPLDYNAVTYLNMIKKIPVKGFEDYSITNISYKFCPNCGYDLRKVVDK